MMFRGIGAAALTIAALLSFAAPADAQGVTSRVKARLAAFDGQTLTLQPLAPNGTPAPGDVLRVSLSPQARVVQQQAERPALQVARLHVSCCNAIMP